ncbi:unnamed protein product [Amaranthus hypochondriacus]
MGNAKILKNLATHLGLTCRCGSGSRSKFNIPDVYEPKPKVGSSMLTSTSPSTISSLNAVEMVSMNPYKDFQDSMMEMIAENEISCSTSSLLSKSKLSSSSSYHSYCFLSAIRWPDAYGTGSRVLVYYMLKYAGEYAKQKCCAM